MCFFRFQAGSVSSFLYAYADSVPTQHISAVSVSAPAQLLRCLEKQPTACSFSRTISKRALHITVLRVETENNSNFLLHSRGNKNQVAWLGDGVYLPSKRFLRKTVFRFSVHAITACLKVPDAISDSAVKGALLLVALLTVTCDLSHYPR